MKMKNTKKNHTKSPQEEWLDAYFQTIEENYRELEMHREPYKCWWREMLKAYKEKQLSKSAHPDL